MAESHEKAAMISGSARNLYPADNIEGVDLDPAPGKIHIQAAKDTTVMDQKMSLKDPDNKTFDLKNVQSFDMKVVDRKSGEFAHMSIESDVQFDADGDGKDEKGMLCAMQDGLITQYSKKPAITSSFMVFLNEGGQAVTILEETPTRLWTPDSAV